MAETNETQRDLEQRALRNVRALVDSLERLDPPRPSRMPMLLMAGAVCVTLVGLAIAAWVQGGEETKERERRICETDAWAKLSGERERQLRQEHPDLPYERLQKKLELERPALMAKSKRACDPRPAKA